jgi:hypothetical protein
VKWWRSLRQRCRPAGAGQLRESGTSLTR